MVTDQYIKYYLISEEYSQIEYNMEGRIQKQKDLKHIDNSLFCTRNYSKRAYDDRNDYRSLFACSQTLILQFTNRHIQLAQRNATFSQQLTLLNQESLSIISILTELSFRLKRQCKQKYELFTLVFDYTVQTINRLKRLYEMNLCQYSKNSLKEQSIMETTNIIQNSQIRKQNQLLIKQKQHKWRNLYMIVKDNRVLRRQKGKLLRKNRQEVWRAKRIEEELIYHQRLNQKYRFLLDSLKEEESYKDLIKYELEVTHLQKKIREYPRKARKILKDQLLELEIKELNSFDKKIGKILEILQRDNQFYDDYDDCEENIETVKLFYNISTQTEVQLTDQYTNTISQPPKVFQSCKVQTKTHQLSWPLQIEETFSLKIHDALKKKNQRPQRKTRYGYHGTKMNQTSFSHMKLFQKKSSVELSSRPILTDSTVKIKKILTISNVVSLNIQNIKSEAINMINKMTSFSKKQKIKHKQASSRRKINLIDSIQSQIVQPELHKATSRKIINRPKKYVNTNELSKQIDLCISSQIPLCDSVQKPIIKEENKIVQKKHKGKQKKLRSIKNLKNQIPEQVTKDRIRIHKRQRTQIDNRKYQWGNENRQNNLIPHQSNEKNSERKISSFEIKQTNEESLLIMNTNDNLQKKLKIPLSSTFSNYFQGSSMDKQIHKKQIPCSPEQQQYLNNKYIMNITDKILKNILLRRKQLLTTRPNFMSYLLNFFTSLYGNTHKKNIYLLKFKNALMQSGTIHKQDKQQEQLTKYEDVFMIIKRLIMIKEQMYDNDIFVLFVTLVDTADKVGIPISPINYQQAHSEYAQKIIQYVSSVYFTEEQTSRFLDKYKIVVPNFNVNLWKYFYCLEGELNKIVQQSQIKQLLNQFVIRDSPAISFEQINEVTSAIGSVSVLDSLKHQGLKKYAIRGTYLHRIVLYGYRYEWNNLLNIKQFIGKYSRHTIHPLSRLYIPRMLEYIDEEIEKQKDSPLFPFLQQVYKKWRKQYDLTNGHSNMIIPNFLYTVLKLMISNRDFCEFKGLKDLESAYAQLIRLRGLTSQ